MTDEKLLPCPFCGSEASIREVFDEYQPYCDSYNGSSENISCPASGGGEDIDNVVTHGCRHQTKESAIKAWNTRANAESCKPTEVKPRKAVAGKPIAIQTRDELLYVVQQKEEQIRILREGLEYYKKEYDDLLHNDALVAKTSLAAADKLNGGKNG